MALSLRSLVPASALTRDPLSARQQTWSLDTLAGRFVELSGAGDSATLTTSAGLIREAQMRGELAAWIGGQGSSFFPRDFAASGIDLEALPVVRVGGLIQAARAADTLLRSGGFLLLIMDLGATRSLPMAAQNRLMGLAQKHHTALVALTGKSQRGSSQSLVSLRGESGKHRTGRDCFQCDLHIVKDKRRTPGWSHTEMCHGPDGLC